MKENGARTIILLLCLLLVFFLLVSLLIVYFACYPMKPSVPEAGVWYNDSMQMQLSFEHDVISFVTIEGEKMTCLCINNQGSKRIKVISQDENWENQYPMGRSMFAADVLRFDSEELVLIEDGCEYIFRRIQ